MRLALVTGGHRRLGAAIAATLARAGYALAIHGSRECTPEPALADALAETGAEWAGFVADFTDPLAAEPLMDAVIARFGRAPDLLVNNASMFGGARFGEADAGELMAYHAVNCASPALLTQAFAAAPGDGNRAIVNLLDQRIDQPHGDQFAYTLSKIGLAGLTQIAARALAPRVRVNAVAPGLTLPTADYADEQMARLGAAMPLRRLPDPAQIAEAVLYLAGATAVTGQTLYVDAGAHLVAFDRDFVDL